ncbi:hypothetical protein ACFQXB_10575 [Plastorhodobacter daqingensis]|uniref:Flagellar protein FlgN n=1 Tax=Plastorhodobacter daqingensis TaxID=1387281 RepID=A0ABW2UIW9_9RHOB
MTDAAVSALGAVLDRCANELAALSQEAARIDQLVGAALAQEAGQGTEMRQLLLQEGQKVDYLRQGIEDMTRFMTRLSQEVPASVQVNSEWAIGLLHLQDLAERLVGPRATGSMTQTDLPDAGSVHLF